MSRKQTPHGLTGLMGACVCLPSWSFRCPPPACHCLPGLLAFLPSILPSFFLPKGFHTQHSFQQNAPSPNTRSTVFSHDSCLLCPALSWVFLNHPLETFPCATTYFGCSSECIFGTPILCSTKAPPQLLSSINSPMITL